MSEPANQPPSPQTATAALAEQLDCYRRLAALSREQSQHISTGNTEALLAVLARRESLTTQAAALEETLATIKQDWPHIAATWPAETRAGVEAMYRECRDLLRELTRRDEEDAASLRANLALASSSRHRADADLRAARKINQRYAASAYDTSRRTVDKSS